MTAEYQLSRTLLVGLSQIMLQSNALTGLLFLVGIALTSVPMCLGAIGGSLVAYVVAWVSGAKREHIEQGLYGYNGALVGLACTLYWPAGTELLIVLGLAASFSTLLTRGLIDRLGCPVYTAPFILSVWLVTAFVDLKPAPAAEVSHTGLDNLLLGFGQVLFLDNPLSGLLILLGVGIASVRALCWGSVAVVLSSGFAFLIGAAQSDVFSGLYAYNAVLIAIALSPRGERDTLVFIAAILLSVIATGCFEQIGVPALTAPFVLVCWLALPLRDRLEAGCRAGVCSRNGPEVSGPDSSL